MNSRIFFLEYTGEIRGDYHIFKQKISENKNVSYREFKILKGSIFSIFNFTLDNYIIGEIYLTLNINTSYFVFPMTTGLKDINKIITEEFVLNNGKIDLLKINENVIKYKDKDVFVIDDYEIVDSQGLPCVIRKKLNGN
jgi:hypothetical protein